MRQTFKNIAIEHENVNTNLLLKIANIAINNVISVNDLILSRLVFGIKQRFSTVSLNLPNQEEHMNILTKAKVEKNAILA